MADPNNFLGWLEGMNPNFSGLPWLRRQFSNPTDIFAKSQYGAAETYMPPWMKSSAAPYLGYSTLADILASQGKTDPRLFNQQMQEITRGGQAQQQAIGQNLAQRGWENSGVGAALQQAAGGATADRRAQAVAQNAALEEQRKRSDLDLLMRLFVQPGIDYSAIAAGQYGARQQTSAQNQAAKLGFIGDLLGMFM